MGGGCVVGGGVGLDAVVRCRCWEEGKVSAPPPLRHVIAVDDEGWLGLTLPWEGNEELHERFEAWLAECCAHPAAEFASEWISNWGGYRLFQQRLAELGWERFPTLRAELPEANGGQTSSTAAAAALEELETFRRLVGTLWQTVLVESTTGAVVHEHVAAYGGAFLLGGRSGLDVGVSEAAFFVRRRVDGVTVFSSTDLEQHLLVPPGTAKGDWVRFVDRVSGARLACDLPVARYEGTQIVGYPARLHVERRRLAQGDDAGLTDRLERILRASVAVGNPVLWT